MRILIVSVCNSAFAPTDNYDIEMTAKKGVYFKDFAGPRFHENRGIFSIQMLLVISVSHVLNISWLV